MFLLPLTPTQGAIYLNKSRTIEREVMRVFSIVSTVNEMPFEKQGSPFGFFYENSVKISAIAEKKRKQDLWAGYLVQIVMLT
jgi:hypothetical protein